MRLSFTEIPHFFFLSSSDLIIINFALISGIKGYEVGCICIFDLIIACSLYTVTRDEHTILTAELLSDFVTNQSRQDAYFRYIFALTQYFLS